MAASALRFLSSLTLALAVASLAACSKTVECPTCPTGGQPPPPPPVSLLSVVVSGPASLQAGRDAGVFRATATMSDGTTTPLVSGVMWTSSNPNVLKVNEAGVGTPVANGTVVVSASYQGKTGDTQVVVTSAAPPPAAVNVAGLWKLTTVPNAANRNCTADAFSYEVRLTQSGSTVTATALTPLQGGPRPLPLEILSFKISGTATDAVALQVTITEERAFTRYQTDGVFTGTPSGGRMLGTFNGTLPGGRGGCRDANHQLTFEKL